jgi:hypothetical protein
MNLNILQLMVMIMATLTLDSFLLLAFAAGIYVLLGGSGSIETFDHNGNVN